MESLAQLSDEEFSALASVLGRQEDTAKLSDVVSAISAALPSLDEDASELVGAFMGAENVRVWRGLSLESATELIASSNSLALEDEEREVLASRLATVLKFPVLEVLSKAIDLLTEEDKVFLDARVVTDVRPVFRARQVDDAAGYLLVHTLRIQYQSNARNESTYLALDHSDLEELQRVVQRAINKSEAIASQIDGAGLRIIEIDEE